ncbi:hypothetical protein [Rahnella sp. Larv3_ips]|uniref:hypothetical protein n=1 Tax=Rahnella sp. Larv3_ips TaxID=1896943 RepID=UPI000EFABA55|nr:hypothetical protein [Rahnella sp. Larv3_ips]
MTLKKVSRSGTDKNTEESLKGYKRARDLLLTTPFPASMNNKKFTKLNMEICLLILEQEYTQSSQGDE